MTDSLMFGASKTASSEIADAIEQLDTLSRQQPALTQPIALLRRILPLLDHRSDGGPNQLLSLQVSETAAAAKLLEGIPLLRGESLGIKAAAFRRRWRAVCKRLARHSRAGSDLASFWDRQSETVDRALEEILAGNPSHLESLVQSDGPDGGSMDGESVKLALRFTLFPDFCRQASATEPWRSAPHWPNGFCPVCGSWPLLAELRGLEQVRYLRCGLCASDWQHPRMQCPFCSATDHHLLGHFHVHGEGTKQRVATCESCHGYVKTVSTLAAFSGPELWVIDLATTHLDLAATDRGYLRH